MKRTRAVVGTRGLAGLCMAYLVVACGDDGAATVNIHREAFLRHWQARMDRCQAPLQ